MPLVGFVSLGLGLIVFVFVYLCLLLSFFAYFPTSLLVGLLWPAQAPQKIRYTSATLKVFLPASVAGLLSS